MNELRFVGAGPLAELLREQPLVVVAFVATWNQRCQAFAERYLALALACAETTPPVPLVAVDVDESTDLNALHGVCSVPTVLLMREGRELRRQQGTDLAAVRDWLRAERVSGLD